MVVSATAFYTEEIFDMLENKNKVKNK